ncbi:MAG TPA: response regulator transcription factor [Acidimicrobiales bacterium]|jgi:DNA-binding NarL/FixJ family response regulator|nr:response regulator transcription factor [Acidimicrobiales bacterium]
MGENLSVVPAPEAAHSPVRLLLVDDHQVVLEGLAAMLASQSDRVVIAAATTEAAEALRLAAERQPDVVLLDVRLRGASGLDLCAELVRRHPGLKVVFFTVYDDEQYLFQALRVGASGFLLKTTTGPELADHLDRVVEGDVAVDPALAGRVAMTAARLQSGEFWPGARLGLTQRESEVLGLIVRGLSNRAIALRLSIGEDTVKTHVRGILRKLEVSDRAQAVAVALREGIFH